MFSYDVSHFIDHYAGIWCNILLSAISPGKPIWHKHNGYKIKGQLSHRTYGSSNSNWYVKFQMFMSARAFWRVSYFAVFYTEYLNFSWYNLIEAYIFSISIGRIIDNQLLQCIYPFILSLGDKNNTSKYRRANVI